MHPHVEGQLSAYLDRELPPDQEAVVRRHVEGCVACQEELARLAHLKRLLSALPQRAAPDLWPPIRRALAEGQVRRPAWWTVWRERPAVAAAAAAAVLLLLLLPLARGQIDRLRAAEFGADLFVREHAISAADDPLVDRAYLSLLVTDANLVIVGARPREVPR
ncbi:MAG TPA: zf-HC2 domain-containing protein [bacterium]|jgi:anti-sigma factor RsiW|nr:zf-HC2 domain-containing protein [bacterium]